MDFESIVKIIVVALTVVGIPVAAYAAIVATRAIWVKPGQQGDKVEELGQEVEALRSRLSPLSVTSRQQSRTWEDTSRATVLRAGRYSVAVSKTSAGPSTSTPK